MSSDWVGGDKSVYTTLGASNHTERERAERDYYATEPRATELLLAEECFHQVIWEPAAGELHMSNVLSEAGYTVVSTDIVRRIANVLPGDFLADAEALKDRYIGDIDFDIVTNPPYKYALEFAQKALDILPDGCKLAMFLKLTFLEGKARKDFFSNNPPETVYVSSSRLKCAPNGDFDSIKSSASAYAWFVWTKGVKTLPVIKWIN